jgi:hypothetical protein
LLAVAAAALSAAGMRNAALVRARAERRLTSAEPLNNAPPLIAFTTVVLGGFRGMLVDLLWLRVSSLQDEGRYFELVQLADWIGKLEPRCTDIWAFHAWNLAYNVSVVISDPEDRWRWVKTGIDLLRDEGLQYNPGDPVLYTELGWLFLHKVGSPSDACGPYYRRQWAVEMTSLFGGGYPDYPRLAPADSEARRRCLAYGLVPEAMKGLDALYGPLDWRTPEAHAIYWAWRGRQQMHGNRSLRCDRMIVQGLGETVLNGGLDFQPERDVYRTSPRLDLFPKVRHAYEDALRQYGPDAFGEAYEFFLRRAARVFWRAGAADQAREAFDACRGRFPATTNEVRGFEAFVQQP